MAHLVQQVQAAEMEFNNFSAQVGDALPSDKQRAEQLLVNDKRSSLKERAEKLLVDPSFRAFTAENAHTAASSHTATVSEKVLEDAAEGSQAERKRAEREKRDKAYTDVTALLHNDEAQAAVQLAKATREERSREGPLGRKD